MEKTTLCSTCANGLVRESDCANPGAIPDYCKTRHITVKCLEGDDYPLQPITSCNEFIRDRIKKTTYHDPDFAEYEKKMTMNAETSHCARPGTQSRVSLIQVRIKNDIIGYELKKLQNEQSELSNRIEKSRGVEDKFPKYVIGVDLATEEKELPPKKIHHKQLDKGKKGNYEYTKIGELVLNQGKLPLLKVIRPRK
jgi:hypothetical protein